MISRTLPVILAISGIMASTAACNRGAGKTGASSGRVAVEPLFTHEGYTSGRFEYYGYHHFLTPAAGGPAIKSKLSRPPMLRRTHAGCKVYDYEYYGPQSFAICDGAEGQRGGPVEHVFTHQGCAVYRYEHYGWNYFARCGAGAEDTRGKLTSPVAFLFEHDGCRVYRFEYYGWHVLTHCAASGGANRPGAIKTPPKQVASAGGCRGYWYEFYGNHHFTRCPGVQSASVTRLLQCGQNCVRELVTPSVMAQRAPAEPASE